MDLDFLDTVTKWDAELRKDVPTYTKAEKQEIRSEWEREKAAHVVACPRSPVKDWRSIIPDRYIEALEQNQKLPSCCRHPENHEIEAWYSNSNQEAKKEPDIYIFYCTCGRRHRRLCGGVVDTRPFWEIR